MKFDRCLDSTSCRDACQMFERYNTFITTFRLRDIVISHGRTCYRLVTTGPCVVFILRRCTYLTGDEKPHWSSFHVDTSQPVTVYALASSLVGFSCVFTNIYTHILRITSYVTICYIGPSYYEMRLYLYSRVKKRKKKHLYSSLHWYDIFCRVISKIMWLFSL